MGGLATYAGAPSASGSAIRRRSLSEIRSFTHLRPRSSWIRTGCCACRPLVEGMNPALGLMAAWNQGGLRWLTGILGCYYVARRAAL